MKSYSENIKTAFETVKTISENLNKVIIKQENNIRKLLAAFVSGGHVLLEDYPGTGKTMLSKSFARSIESDFKRIQFTPDLLPSDIIGIPLFDPETKKFQFRQGPIFTNILLADEINRASPRTQSALLECMGEQQVTVEEKTYPLKDPFFVIATQNPLEFHGTYPLPEALLDRFSMKFSLGYVSEEEEAKILSSQKEKHPFESLKACASPEEIQNLRTSVKSIHISDELTRYIVSLTNATRNLKEIKLGAGPRASLALMEISRGLALCDGMDFVTPEHIKEVVIPVIAHRISLEPQAIYEGGSAENVITELLKTVPCPS
ncbi:MAG: MoxR family ATPase [Nitrospinae bacterium]|nr:MoxR family ATPase [Nitrospinota bacterium]